MAVCKNALRCLDRTIPFCHTFPSGLLFSTQISSVDVMEGGAGEAAGGIPGGKIIPGGGGMDPPGGGMNGALFQKYKEDYDVNAINTIPICGRLHLQVKHAKQMGICTCKGGAPMGGGTLGSKGIRPKGGWAGGGGPLIMAKGGTGVLSNGCLREPGLAGGGAAVGKRSAGC